QGDEPELSPTAVLRVAEVLLDDATADMSTLVVAMPVGTEALKSDPNAVKAVIDARGRAIYFSRAPVPFDRVAPPAGQPLWHHHLGVYAYRTKFLQEFAAMPTSALEERESLEQLRALEAGRTIRVGVVPAGWAGKGIDAPADYAAFVERRRADQAPRRAG
ncbi:MAG: cytidylyltransferase domain-containing protein, partial [Planctomycetia bacterium]